ncbi:peptide chain release factor N(5)-glutamine methyltransferase [Patescibacteria group bacterium]|nr:peptide chain release factor N(5)-glutamine methyltransferase [Patescibacteria group bacterium]MBU1673129.1 peptide chain release factor N(5)-glutamine methyltransferase [Patescibacteria group bacterium]MBU1963807.1 peptide chain release factor N(5)-glutamine methyltransferase [Patescibacteria group bacterium]
MTIEQALIWAKTPYLDSEVLLAFTLKKPREFLVTHSDKKLTKNQELRFRKYIARRLKGEPVAYIRGFKEFFEMDFIVNKNVLIPRPDTELLIETVLDNVKKGLLIDVGTGSGCIPVTLKKYLPKAEIIGTDISEKALSVAKKNARLHLDHENTKDSKIIKFYKGDTLKAIPNKYKGKIDVIVSNPPYLTKTEAGKKGLAYEPQVALLCPDGQYSCLYKIIDESKEYLKPGGQMFFEIGYKQAKKVIEYVNKVYPKAKITIYKDLGGFDRVVKIST